MPAIKIIPEPVILVFDLNVTTVRLNKKTNSNE